MGDDEEILRQALEQAVPAYAAKKVSTSLLGQPSPDNTILDPVCAAIEKCNAYRAVAGHMLFSAGAGVVIHAPRLATDLVYRAERGISDAVEWLLRLLSTREVNGILKAAIWGLSIDEEIPLSGLSKLMPFESLPDSRLKDIILHRSRQMYDNSAWLSTQWFDQPRAAFITEVSNFPYIGTDGAAFQRMEELVWEARDLWTLIEATSVGHPLAFGYWFEYEDGDLDIAQWENNIFWSLPEIVPQIPACTTADANLLKQDIRQYMALSEKLRFDLLRSMDRFTLSQCRRQVIDRVLDLALAFEIAVSGDGGNAPPGWKVSVRAAQMIGGALGKRQAYRETINELYRIRNQATHGSSLNNLKRKQTDALESSAAIFRDLVRSFLRLGGTPDWDAIELEPIFRGDDAP